MDIHSTHSTRSISIWNSHLPYRFYCRGSMGATSSAHSADRFGFIMVYSLRFIAIHCDSWATLGHINWIVRCAPLVSPHVTVGVLFVFFLLSSCSKDHSLPKPATIDLWTVQLYVSSSGLNILNILNTGSIMFHHVPSVWKLFESRLKSLELGAAMRRCGLSMRLSTLDSLLLPQFVKRAKFCHDCRSWRGGRSGEAEKWRRAGEKNCKYQKHDHHVAARGGNALTSSPMFKDAQSKPC